MEIRFEAMLYSNLGNENSDAGNIECSRGPQVPHPWSSWNEFIAAVHAPTTFRMVFYTFCYYFWGQHGCWTETNILVKNFLLFISFHFPQDLLTHCSTVAPATTCGLHNSTYKLSISTDMIVEIQIAKLLAKLVTESYWRKIFFRLKYATHLNLINFLTK